MANSADEKLMKFSYFLQKTGFDISCKLSPMLSVRVNMVILFVPWQLIPVCFTLILQLGLLKADIYKLKCKQTCSILLWHYVFYNFVHQSF